MHACSLQVVTVLSTKRSIPGSIGVVCCVVELQAPVLAGFEVMLEVRSKWHIGKIPRCVFGPYVAIVVARMQL